MAANANSIEIDHAGLMARLEELQMESDGDVARLIELLLLENQILALRQSTGMHRGLVVDLSSYPRFLELKIPGAEVVPAD